MNNKKMKWIEYFSENGDLWQLFVEDDYQETQADTLAHNGNEAVTRREMPAIDKVQVTIIPAARIVDKVKGQVAGEKLLFVNNAKEKKTQVYREKTDGIFGDKTFKNNTETEGKVANISFDLKNAIAPSWVDKNEAIKSYNVVMTGGKEI